MYRTGVENADTGAWVAMVGQVPASVEGPVADQDLLIPSGNNDGKMKALGRNVMHNQRGAWSSISRIVAIAWESQSDKPWRKVNAFVGPNLGHVARALAHFESGLRGFEQGIGASCDPLLAHRVTDAVSKLLPEASNITADVTSENNTQQDSHTTLFSTDTLLQNVGVNDLVDGLSGELAQALPFLLMGLVNELNDPTQACSSSDARPSIEAAVDQILTQLGEEVHW